MKNFLQHTTRHLFCFCFGLGIGLIGFGCEPNFMVALGTMFTTISIAEGICYIITD